MKQGQTKNYGCLAGIVILFLLYVVLNILVLADRVITKMLSNPIVYYGIPIGILFIIYLNARIEEKNKDKKSKKKTIQKSPLLGIFY